MNNVLFIHVATIGNYQHILDEIISYVNPFDFNKIFVNIAGDLDVSTYNIATVIPQRSKLLDYEFSTLDILRKYCTDNPCNICYIHTKGASTNSNICIDEWRQYMLYFNLGKAGLISHILEKYDACGVDLVNTPTTHFSGNFWWSTAQHINSLQAPHELPVILSERHKCEFWICSNPQGKYYSLHNSNIDVYSRHLTRYPRNIYENSNN